MIDSLLIVFHPIEKQICPFSRARSKHRLLFRDVFVEVERKVRGVDRDQADWIRSDLTEKGVRHFHCVAHEEKCVNVNFTFHTGKIVPDERNSVDGLRASFSFQ